MSKPENHNVLDLEHCIGFNGTVKHGLLFGEGESVVLASGSTAILGDLSDPHKQDFLRGHTTILTALALSPKRTYLASGNGGANPDVCVWDYKEKKLMYRLEEHLDGIPCLAFSEDERFLATVGGPTAPVLYIWDMLTGCIVGTSSLRPVDCKAFEWGGRVKDVKRRNTTDFLFATAGDSVFLWALTPSTGIIQHQELSTGSHRRLYTCLKFTADYRYLLASSESGDITIFNVFSHKHIGHQAATNGIILSMVVWGGGRSPVIVAVGSSSGEITILEQDMEDEDRPMMLGGSLILYPKRRCSVSVGVSSLSISSDLKELLCGTVQGDIYRIRTTNLEMIHVAANHISPVTAVSFHPDESSQFATVCLEGRAIMWDASTYAVIASNVLPGVGGTDVCVSDDLIITSWEDGRIRAFANTGSKCWWQITDAHKAPIRCMSLAKNQKFVATGSDSGVVRIWNIRTRTMVSHIKEHTAAVNGLHLFDDSKHAISCSRDRSFFCWDLLSEKRVSTHRQELGGINDITLTSDQTGAISVGQERSIGFWDLRSRDPVSRTQSPHGKGEALTINLSGDGITFATGGTDNMVKLWDTRRPDSSIAEGLGHSSAVAAVCFAPDQKQLVSVGYDGAVFLWNVFNLSSTEAN